jgi:hypothetical protein
MNRRAVLTLVAATLAAGAARAQPKTAYVDRDPQTGRYHAYLNGRHVGPANGFATAAEAWAYLRSLGA